jgi:hypothetical protein
MPENRVRRVIRARATLAEQHATELSEPDGRIVESTQALLALDDRERKGRPTSLDELSSITIAACVSERTQRST